MVKKCRKNAKINENNEVPDETFLRVDVVRGFSKECEFPCEFLFDVIEMGGMKFEIYHLGSKYSCVAKDGDTQG